jgi:hypothetical protein
LNAGKPPEAAMEIDKNAIQHWGAVLFLRAQLC